MYESTGADLSMGVLRRNQHLLSSDLVTPPLGPEGPAGMGQCSRRPPSGRTHCETCAVEGQEDDQGANLLQTAQAVLHVLGLEKFQRLISARENKVSTYFGLGASLPAKNRAEGAKAMTASKIRVIGSVLVSTGCAEQPDQIAAVEIGSDAYARHSCSQLAAEDLKVNQEVANLSARQKSAANGDAWGVFLIGLPVSSMGGGDQEAAISVAKGKQQAIDRQQLAKRCG